MGTASFGVREGLPSGVTVLERGWLSSNNIVVVGKSSSAVVDSGYSTHSAQTTRLVSMALGGRPLDLLINTHLHSDHCGGNAALQAAYPALRTLIPPGEAAAVGEWDPVALTFEATGQVCARFSVSGVLSPGGCVQLGDLEWEVHAAPGHDPNSVILFHRQSRTLLSADALWEQGFGVVFPELEGHSAFHVVGETLDLIQTLDAAIVVPGHGRPFTDVGSAIDRASKRLAGYLAAPERHAEHAAKVLLKFKLLELQQVPRANLKLWAGQTRYLGLLHSQWFAGLAFDAWIDSLLNRLAQAGAVSTQGEYIVNL